MDFMLFERTVSLFTFRHYFPGYSHFFSKRLSLPEERMTCFSILKMSFNLFGKAKSILTNIVFFLLFFAVIVGFDVLVYFSQEALLDWCVRILEMGLLLWKFDVFFLPKAYLILFLSFLLISLVLTFYFSISMFFMVLLMNVLASRKEDTK